MPYISRDENGKIDALLDKAQDPKLEFLPINHPEVLLFISQSGFSDPAKIALSASDHEAVRVIEDLINVLVEKQIILHTDLPKVARQKLQFRNQLRENPESLDNLIVDDNDIL